jgi:7-cyano-7-deazaguanine synthase
VLLLSGGLDSYTAGALVHQQGFDLFALSIRYGQVHAKEIAAARAVARALGVAEHVEIAVDLRAIAASALTGHGAVPKDRPASADGIPSTYVPARNTIFLSLALAWAETLGASDIVIGVNARDYSGYPDCRPEYIAAFERLAGLATRAGVTGAAFAMTKVAIIRTGIGLQLNYGLTNSCYDPGEDGRPCRRCDSCVIRANGFAEAGIEDPLNGPP